ncbi:hypothetical protein [Chondrinema litorale]|uniref:hypothetical protein n=1 Tax=Chondrinema litorale TaxID=2994555 RepID=UPI002543844D|nr:hypothetical protein [Chondrinema litorale]UZR97859.1 hypothetical protein OQ292_29020 [Chondrinema litorale]
MRKLLFIFFISLEQLAFSQGLIDTNDIAKRIYPPQVENKINLSSYDIFDNAQISKDELIIIAKPKEYKSDNGGLRMIYLVNDDDNFNIKFQSQNMGEAYVYEPYFFQFANNEILIFAEKGYEYTVGFDVFSLKEKSIKHLGFVGIAGSLRDSAVDQMRVLKEKNIYKLKFSGTIEVKPPSDRLVAGEKVEVIITENRVEIKEN